VERRVKKICRLSYSPLAVTNSNEFDPGCRRGAVPPGRPAARGTDGQRRSPGNAGRAESGVRQVGARHVRPRGRRARGPCRRFPGRRRPVRRRRGHVHPRPVQQRHLLAEAKERIGGVDIDTSYAHFYVEGRLSVDGRDLGAPVIGRLGRYVQCCSEDTKSLKLQRFSLAWPHQDETRGSVASRQRSLERQELRVRCERGECCVFVRKRHLELQAARANRPAARVVDPGLGESRAMEELSALLGREPSVSRADDDGWTDLHYAAVLDLPDAVSRLLDEGAVVGRQAQERPGAARARVEVDAAPRGEDATRLDPGALRRGRRGRGGPAGAAIARRRSSGEKQRRRDGG